MDESRERLCVTGLSGLVGSILARHLGGRHDLVALNRRDTPGIECVRADISDLGAVRRAVRGCHAIIHLAAYPFPDDNWEQMLPSNLTGTYNVLEAARLEGVRRLVFASSLSVIAGNRDRLAEFWDGNPRHTQQEKVHFLETLSYPRPDGLYGASKVWGEELCRVYADTHGIACVALRLGEVRPDDRPNPDDPLGSARWCSHADLLAATDRALALTREIPFTALSVISADVDG